MLVYIFIIFIILLIIEYFIYKFLNQNKHIIYDTNYEIKQLKNNRVNEKTIIELFKNKINERLEMLKNMDYQAWLRYNQNNSIITHNNIKYNIFIYEKTNFEHTFINRCSHSKELINQNYLNEREMIIHRSEILKTFPPSKNLPKEMYTMPLNHDGFNNISYNWQNFFTDNPVLNNTIFTKYNINSFDGIIGISYTKDYLDVKYKELYFNYFSKIILFFLHFIILFIACVIFYINKKSMNGFIRSIILLISSWLFLIFCLFSNTSITNINNEMNLNRIIYENLLGIAFLMGVNLFIINYYKKSDIVEKELIFLLCFVVVFLFLSLFKLNNYLDINYLMIDRIKNQTLFNMSMFFNFCIFIIFIQHFLKINKIF
jgi:hypothetical protein